MGKIDQTNAQFITKFITAYKQLLNNSYSTITFENSTVDMKDLISVKNETCSFYLFYQQKEEVYYTLNCKYHKYLKEKKYNQKTIFSFKDKNTKICEQLKTKNNAYYRFLHGNIWTENKKIVNRYILKFNAIYIELDDYTYNELYLETINIEKQRSMNLLNIIINNSADNIMNVVNTLKNILGNNIFRD